MFKKILVPLDGSTEAETVLPYVRDIAIRFDSEVDILGVGLGSKRRRVNQLLDSYVHHAVEHLQKNEITCRAVLLYSDSHQELLDYTEITAREHQIKAKGQILYGGPPESILAYSRGHHTNLIIMATHGISGIRRWWLGSVFEKVVSRATVPVLGIHSKQVREMDRDRKAVFKRILAPLDGSETGGAAMRDVEAIALKTGASIVLVHVLPEPHAIEARWLGPEFTGFVKAMNEAGQKIPRKSRRTAERQRPRCESQDRIGRSRRQGHRSGQGRKNRPHRHVHTWQERHRALGYGKCGGQDIARVQDPHVAC